MEKMNISAAPGQPSTFWQGASGRWYRSMKLAETDIEGNAVNPEDYMYTKSFWAHNKKTVIWCLVATVIIVGMIFLWKKGKITIKTT